MCPGQNSHCDHQPQASAEDAHLRESLARIRHKLLVMSGKGGVGKSSIAVYLSLALAKLGYEVGLLDIDLHGPSIPRMLGISGMFEIDGDRGIVPHACTERLEVVSIECLLEDRDSAIIWRGPVKHGVIRQFVGDVRWGALDFLIIDSPPGTGDEPLSVAQTIPDAHAIVVTTPQEVALADVRKSIDFCRKVHMPILGVVENMNGLICPHCNQEVPLFRKNGGARMAESMGVRLLGSLPFDSRVVESGDRGVCLPDNPDGSPFMRALEQMVSEVVHQCGSSKTGAMDA